jgi:hypothetical protein
LDADGRDDGAILPPVVRPHGVIEPRFHVSGRFEAPPRPFRAVRRPRPSRQPTATSTSRSAELRSCRWTPVSAPASAASRTQAGFGTGEPTSRRLYLLRDRPSADDTLVGGRAGGGNDLLAGNDSISAEDLIEDIVDGGAGSELARIDVGLDRVQRVEDTRRWVSRARGG